MHRKVLASEVGKPLRTTSMFSLLPVQNLSSALTFIKAEVFALIHSLYCQVFEIISENSLFLFLTRFVDVCNHSHYPCVILRN